MEILAGLIIASTLVFLAKKAEEKGANVVKQAKEDGILPAVRDAIGAGEDEASKKARLKKEEDERAYAIAHSAELTQAFKDYTAAHPEEVGKAAGGTAAEGTPENPEITETTSQYLGRAWSSFWSGGSK